MTAKPLLLLVLSISLFLLVPKGAAGQAYTINKTLDSGDPTTHIDLAIIGSGFAPSELGAYIAKADGNIAQMFSVNWFSANRNLFNVWRIDASSPQSGTDLNDTTIYSIASHVPYDILIVLHNYDGQEGVNNQRVDLYKYSDSYIVLAHELGHVIGDLRDEYYEAGTSSKCTGSSKFAPNIHDKPSNEKWSGLVATAPVEGGSYCATGLWRPSANSIMRDSANTRTFDAVGLRAMDLGAGKMLGTVESNPPSLSISGLNDGDTKSGTLSVQAVTSDASGIDRVEFYWAKAGDTSRSIKIDRTAPYDLSVDTTQYPNGQYYLDTLSYDSNWNYARRTMLFTISNSPPSGTLITPIIVQEALPSGIPGIARTNEPLTAGIPLAEDSGIASVSQLSLSGASVQQFRPLAYWPNGNIKWVLIDTQATVSAGGQATLNLMNTANNPPGAGLASDQGSYILVNTGAAQFKIKKANFNMIDQAMINGQELVTSGNQGGLSLLGFNNVTYDSKNDASSTATIEENGPARTVVKIMGSFKSASGVRFMDYTVRLHFFKDQTFVRPVVELRNAAQENNNPTKKTFSNAQVNIPLNLGATKQFEFATNSGLVSGTISNSAYIYQAFSMAHVVGNPTENDDSGGNLAWIDPPMDRLTGAVDANYVQKGIEIKNGQNALHSLGNQNEWTSDYAEIKDQAGAGLTVTMQYMSSFWPSSFEFNASGSVEIGIFSKYNSKKNVTMGWGTHETRELILDFHTSAVNNKLDAYRTEESLVGRADIQYYADTKALYGQDEIATGAEFENWFKANYGPLDWNHPMGEWSISNSGLAVWRTYWYSGVAQIDVPLSYLLTFFKNGTSGRYMSGLQKTIFNSDSAVMRSDGFDYSQAPFYEYNLDETGSFNRGGGKNEFDLEHNHWQAMPLYYYVTGNEEIKEAINDYAEKYVKYYNDGRFVFGDMRLFSRSYRTLALAYEFTGDSRLKTALEALTNKILDSRDNPPNVLPDGRNLERGYIWGDSDGAMDGALVSNEPMIHSFFIYTFHPEDTWQGLRVLEAYDKSYPRAEELEDYLLGLAQFTYSEPLLVNPVNNDFGYPYDYSLIKPNQWIDNYPTNYMRKDESSRLMLIGYQQTGDTKYLDRGNKLLAIGGGEWATSPYPAHELVYADLHGIGPIWQYINNVSSAKNPDGTYTLRWTVPQGATAYQVKYSDKPIVDWLGFNQTTRAYQYDPSQYTAFFAATNIDNEPAPGAAGSVETYTIDLSQAASSYDSARSLAPSNPSYVSYSPSKQYYFSVKYLSAQAGQTQALSITTTSLPNGQTLSAYSQALSASGGTSPYTWSLISGSLPPGLSLSPAGLISGTPTLTGTSSFTVKATDSGSNTSSKALSIIVVSQPPSQTCQGQGYSCCSSCQSGPHSQYDSTCTGQVCCDSCASQPSTQSGKCGNIVLLHHYDNQSQYGESATKAYDFSGNGNNGTCAGASCPTWSATGKFSGALAFNGNDYVALPNGNSYLNPNEGTIAFWYESNNSSPYFYFYQYNFGGCASIQLSTTGPNNIRAIYSAGCNPAQYIDTTVDNMYVAQPGWHFFSFSWDRTNNTLSTFYDGAYKIQSKTLGAGAFGSANSVIGYDYYDNRYFYSGLIDEFSVWNRTRSSQEVQSLYSSGKPISCAYRADTSGDGCVSMPELQAFINRWKLNNQDVNLKDLIEAIGLWKRGCS